MQGAFDKLAELRPKLAKGPVPEVRDDEFLSPVHRQAAENRVFLGDRLVLGLVNRKAIAPRISFCAQRAKPLSPRRRR